MAVVDRWHKSRPEDNEPRCREHKLVPSTAHGDGDRWQVRWRDDNGAQRKQNFTKRAPADTFDAKVKTDLARGNYVDPRAGKIILETYAEQWRRALTSDPVTREHVTSLLKVHVYPDLGQRTMGELARRPSAIQQWIKSMEKDLAASTIKGIVGLVSTIFSAAIDDGIVNRNPVLVRSVRRPRVERKKVTPWALAQLTAVAAELGRYEAMAFLGAGCGHRQGELFGVAVDDIDFLGRVVHVRRQVRLVEGAVVFSPPKGGKTRTVPLPDTVGLRLAAHIKAHPPMKVTLPWRTPTGEPHTAELLFVNADGRPLDRGNFNRLWRPALERAGAPGGRENGTHVLRHTSASAWLAAGVDVRTVAEYLGHTDPGFTLRTYAWLMPNAADRARKAMDAFFAQHESEASALDVPSARP